MKMSTAVDSWPPFVFGDVGRRLLAEISGSSWFGAKGKLWG